MLLLPHKCIGGFSIKDFIFDLQRFDDSTVTLAAGETHADDNVTYTAGDDGAELKLTDGKVSGITSGSVVAKLNGDSSPAVTFDGSTAFDFACSENNSALKVEALGSSIAYAGGNITYSAQGISGAGEVSVTGMIGNILPFTVTFDIPDAGAQVTFDDGKTTVNAPETVNANLTLPEGMQTILENIKPLIPILLNVDEDTANKLYDTLNKLVNSPITAQIQGVHTWNQNDKQLTITDGSNLALNILDYSVNLAAQGGNVDGLSFFYERTDDSLNAGAKFTPSTDENASLKLMFTKDGSKIYDGLLNVTAGAIAFDVVNAKASVEKDTAVTITQGDNRIEATFNDAASLTYSADENGIAYLTFGKGDGSVEFKLYRDDKAILTAGVEINGALTIDTENQTLGVTKDTVTKISIGEYEATLSVTGDAGITITPSNDKFTVTAGDGDGSLDIKVVRGERTVFDGNMEIVGSIEFDPTAHALSVSKDSTVTLTRDDNVITLKATDDAGLAFSVEGDNITLTPNNGDGSLDITMKRGEKTIFDGNLNISGGSIEIDNAAQSISITKDTTITLTQDERVISVTANDDAGITITRDDDKFIITPGDDDGSLDLSIKKGDDTIFSNTVSVSGSIVLDNANKTLGLTKDSALSIALDNYTFTAKATDDANVALTFTDDGLVITPATGDGTLDLTLTGAGGSMNANLEVLSGSFILGDGKIFVTKDTELNITFSDDYAVKFKATADAGGLISLGTDGITFAPGSDDGGLELSVTRGDETRTASLDVTGSVTYKLDGSISLAKDTVVKNVFEDGNTLTITANTDASGSIRFSPDSGLLITPATPDALTVSLTTGGVEVVNITSIDGSITYSGGLITATDGTKARIEYYFGWESDLYTKGGTASLQFTTDRTVYIANEGANFVLDYLDGTTAEIQNGTYSDIYATETSDAIELVSVGSTFRSNDNEQVITLEKAGTYTLNGMQVTTSQDNTQVLMPDYDTVQFAADEEIKVSTVEGGKIFMVAPGEETISFSTKRLENTEVTGGAVEFDNVTQKLSATEDTTLTITRDNVVTTFTATDDTSLSYKIEEGIYYFMPDGEVAANISVTNDGTPTFAGSLTAGGVLSFNPATGTCGLTGATSSHGDGTNTYAELTLDGQTNTYSIKAQTDSDTLVFIPTLDDGKLELSFPNEAKHALKLTFSKDGQEILSNHIAVDGTLGWNTETKEFYLTKDTIAQMSFGDSIITATAPDDTAIKIATADGKITFKADEEGTLNLSVKHGEATTFSGDLTFSAGSSVSVNPSTGEISMTKGTTTTITVGEQTITLTPTDDASVFLAVVDGKIQITPAEGDGSLDITMKRGDNTLTANLEISGGSILADPATNSFSVTQGTTTTLTVGKQKISVTATDDAGITITPNEDGKFTLTPGEGDGTIDLLIKSGDDIIISANVELNGSVELDPAENTLAILPDTTVAFRFGHIDGYEYHRTVSFTADDNTTIKLSDGALVLTEGSGHLNIVADGIIHFDSDVELLSGEARLDLASNEITLAKDTTINVSRGTSELTVTAPNDGDLILSPVNANFVVTPAEDSGMLHIALKYEGSTVFENDVTLSGGSLSLDLYNKELSITKDTTLALDLGDYSAAFTATDDAGLDFAIDDEGKVTLTPGDGDGSLDVTIKRDGKTLFTNNISVNGSIILDVITQNLSLAKDTTVTLKQGSTTLTAKALDEAGIQISFDDGLSISPNEGDGKLEISFTDSEGTTHTATLDISKGGLLFNNDGTFSPKKDTVIDIEWESGYKVKLEANDDGNIISFDDKGLGISADGNLDITLTTETGVEIPYRNVNGSAHYSAGKLIFDKDSTLTTQIQYGDRLLDITMETIGGDGYLSYTDSGMDFTAGTGTLRVTLVQDDTPFVYTLKKGTISFQGTVKTT